MDRRELEIMLNEAFDRGIVSVGHLVHETVEVGFLNELGRNVGFTLNGWKEAIETIPVDLFDSFDDGRGREWFLSDCKALGGKVPQNTYRGELVSALADVLMVEEAAPALGALESALDSARRKGYCVFDRGVHGDVPADGLVYLCSTYPAAVGLKDSLDSIRAQGNDPDTRTLGVYRMVDGYCIMGGLDSGSQADAYAVDADLAEGWGVGDAAFRIADLKAKTFSYAVEAGEAQGASTLVYYTDEGADPVLFQQTDGDWRLASDNFLAENAIVEDLEQAYTGEISPVYLNRDIVDMEEMAEVYGGDGGRRGPRPPSPPSPGRPPRPRQPRSRRPARSPTLPARSRRTPRPDTDTMGGGADAPAGTLAYTRKRSTAHPHIPMHPHPHICVKVARHDQERSETRRHGAYRAAGRQHAIRSHDEAGGCGGPRGRRHEPRLRRRRPPARRAHDRQHSPGSGQARFRYAPVGSAIAHTHTRTHTQLRIRTLAQWNTCTSAYLRTCT